MLVALPIQSLAYCCQFNVLELEAEMCAAHKRYLYAVIHVRPTAAALRPLPPPPAPASRWL